MHDVFYFTDIHGQLKLFEAMRDWCYKQDPECTIIYGGDACDRGMYGYEIMKALLDDPQVIYLMGNHEDMFARAADAIIGHYAKNDRLYERLHHLDEETALGVLTYMEDMSVDVAISLANGSLPTLRAWLIDGADEEFVERIRELPITFTYENIDFCHAGCAYKGFKQIADAEYDGKPLNNISRKGLLWDRNNIVYGWEPGRICVHGHTPVIKLPTKLYKSKDQHMTLDDVRPASWHGKKRSGTRIDMDTGAVFSGRAFVLNCLTMQITGFYDPDVRQHNLESQPVEVLETKTLQITHLEEN